MPKANPSEQDEAKLQKKVQAKLAGHNNPEGDASLRSLRKRLKRAQRKRRAVAARVLRAKGAAGAETKG